MVKVSEINNNNIPSNTRVNGEENSGKDIDKKFGAKKNIKRNHLSSKSRSNKGKSKENSCSGLLSHPVNIREYIKESRHKSHELDFMKAHFERDLFNQLNNEKRKIENQIFELENKFGKDTVRNYAQKALVDCDDLFKSCDNKTFGIATEARFLSEMQSVEELLNFETNGVNKIINNGKSDFSKVLAELNKNIGNI